ncbi:MAG: arsenate reductase ArsC [Bryobacteraceae bacterium]
MNVLILCTGNSARSQMAEGLLRAIAGAEWEVESAGTHPSRVREEAIQAMAEVGIDISSHRSKSVEEFAGRPFDWVITVCDQARERCPVFPAATRRVHWSMEDPMTIDEFRRVRDQLAGRLREFYSTTSTRV